MLRFKPWNALVLVACCALIPIVSSAQTTVEPAASLAAELPVAAVESWVGGVAAIGCGLMTRATIATGGAFVGTIAGALATCALMILDALLT